MATSQNGYPAISSVNNTKNYTIPVKKKFGPRRNLRLRAGHSDSAIVLAHYVLRYYETIERPSKTFDLWGWAYRDIRGSERLSNHASATAVDVNATQHPLGVRGTYSKAQKAKLWFMLKTVYRGVIRHGEWYDGRVDPMHAEIRRGKQKKVARLAKRLRKTARGKRILKANNM